MKYIQGIATALLTLAIAAATAAGAWWLATNQAGSPSVDKPPAAATVNKVIKEDDLNSVTLTEDAEKRIGLAVGQIAKKNVRRTRIYGGEVTIPAGRSILVAAPVTGTLMALPQGMIKAGLPINAKQPVVQLVPLLTPDGRATLSASLADTEGQVNNAKTQVQLTTIALDRAKRALKEGAGSQRQVDEAEAASNLAVRTLDAAVARQSILKKVVGDADAGTAAPIVIESPHGGIIRTISALPGQTVPAGAALFEVIETATIWIRVPLPVGDIEAIDQTAPVQVGSLSGSNNSRNYTARPVAAPPSANPLSATVDAYFELPNSAGKLIPGQRVGVSIPLIDSVIGLTVPWAAIVFDIHGGTWIYEQIGPGRYVRRRVVVGHTIGPDAVLAGGLAVGTTIVVAGAQELFGR